jgi:hypothetical protein
VVISIASSFVANKIWCVVVLTLVNATKELFLNYCRIPRYAQNASRIFLVEADELRTGYTLCMKHPAACKHFCNRPPSRPAIVVAPVASRIFAKTDDEIMAIYS